MEAIILAAGYATRLYPLTLNKAKPLLKVAGKPIVEWVLDNLANIPQLGTVYIVTNDKFANDFQVWSDRYTAGGPKRSRIKIINDGSRTDDDKLGAIGDINFVISRENLTNEDLLIVAGDNLFEQSLAEFVEFAKGTQATVAVHDVGNLEAMKKYGAITINSKGIITHCEEKPAHPKSTLAAIALYYYSRDVTPLVTTYLAAGNDPDAPGRFVQWLYSRKPVKTFQIQGKWLDIGSKETLEQADVTFRKDN